MVALVVALPPLEVAVGEGTVVLMGNPSFCVDYHGVGEHCLKLNYRRCSGYRWLRSNTGMDCIIGGAQDWRADDFG